MASHLRRLEALPLAAEIYRKLGEEAQVVQLHVESRDWSEAFRLAEHLPQVLPSVHVQHAQWLAESDEFIKAHESYILAGKPNEAIKLLKSLAECSISENRFLDASYYMWLRARQFLQSYVRENGYVFWNMRVFICGIRSQLLLYICRVPGEIPDDVMQKFKSLQRLATIYYAYNTIHCYLTEPFTSNSPLTLFNTSRYVANQISVDGGLPPTGISML